jgi:MFS family permease
MRLYYGWVIVGAGMLVTCVGFGTTMSLGVFLEPMSTATGWSRTGVSTAATVMFLAMGAASFAWGWLYDRFGSRAVVLSGGLLLGAGMVAASQATSLWAFQLLFGVVVGLAAGSIYTPMMAATMAWFSRHRSLAVALVSAGMSVGSMTIAPLARWMITTYDWRVAMLAIGAIAWLIMIPAAFLMRRAPDVPQDAPAGPTDAAAAKAADDDPGLTAGQAIRTPQFIAIALTHFACCVCHSGPIFHMVAYGTGCGLAPMVATTVLSVAGLASLAGRIGCGLVADRVGAKPTMIALLMLQAVSVSLYLFVSELGEFYALSLIFGIAYGGVMPLYAILVREYFGPRIMGTTFGAVGMFASLGMALGPWAGGRAFDVFASYEWLYIGSFAIGLGAVAIALTFKPLPSAMRGVNGVAARTS